MKLKDLKQPAIFATIFILSTVVGGKCPDNPRGAIRKYQGSCYEFIKDDVSHPHARELCHKHNGHLVHIENKEKETWIANTVTDDLLWVDKSPSNSHKSIMWIGISREQQADQDGDGSSSQPIWYLDNGNSPQPDISPLKYTNWNTYEPDRTKGRDCAAFGFKTGFKWKAAPCSEYPHEYLVVCQYDGPDGFFNNLAFTISAIVLLVVAVIAGVILFYKCYRKRHALQRQLHEEKSEEPYSQHEYHISNKDVDFSTNNNNVSPNHYAPVVPPATNSFHDFNILADPLHHRDKLLSKDLSLQRASLQYSTNDNLSRPEYSRSVSTPANYSLQYTVATAPPEECAVVMEDNENDGNVDESVPLHVPRPLSVESNNLSV